MTKEQQQRLRRIMQTQGLDEQEARFVMGLADGEINSDVLDDEKLENSATLGERVTQDRQA